MALVAFACARLAQGADRERNWFNDPFFQISAGIADCPLPAGPFITEAERRVQAHHRAEKGTTCWLAGLCTRPNFYEYDVEIAAAFRTTLPAQNAFSAATLWVTVQGRVVYIEGCADREATAAELEAFARQLPHVRQVVATIRTDPTARPPYRLRQQR